MKIVILGYTGLIGKSILNYSAKKKNPFKLIVVEKDINL